jgi:hypothetical protein
LRRSEPLRYGVGGAEYFSVENAVTGIQEAIILSALLLVVAAVIAITAVRPERAAVLPK